MPDLDAMKNWNAYIGKISSRDYCFTPSTQLSFEDDTKANFICEEGSLNYSNSPNYGSVDVNFTFYVQKNFLLNFAILYSKFTGEDVGTQIKEKISGQRIDSKINIIAWINTQRSNYTKTCTGNICQVDGCLIITAPLTSIPTRMPQVHTDFTFASKILNSGTRRPSSCKCEFESLNSTYDVHEHEIMPANKCGKNVMATFEVHKSSSKNKAYGVLEIELSAEDRFRASRHMLWASLSLTLVSVTLTISILFKNKFFL